MRVLLDTQVFVLAYMGESLPKTTQATIEDPQTECVLSAASVMEIAIKTGIGKLDMSLENVSKAARDLRATIVPFTPQHAYRLFSLPQHHFDPFDRMIISTALAESMPVLSGDRQFARYKGLRVLWR